MLAPIGSSSHFDTTYWEFYRPGVGAEAMVRVGATLEWHDRVHPNEGWLDPVADGFWQFLDRIHSPDSDHVITNVQIYSRDGVPRGAVRPVPNNIRMYPSSLTDGHQGFGSVNGGYVELYSVVDEPTIMIRAWGSEGQFLGEYDVDRVVTGLWTFSFVTIGYSTSAVRLIREHEQGTDLVGTWCPDEGECWLGRLRLDRDGIPITDTVEVISRSMPRELFDLDRWGWGGWPSPGEPVPFTVVGKELHVLRVDARESLHPSDAYMLDTLRYARVDLDTGEILADARIGQVAMLLPHNSVYPFEIDEAGPAIVYARIRDLADPDARNFGDIVLQRICPP